jgi:hypothetical protein
MNMHQKLIFGFWASTESTKTYKKFSSVFGGNVTKWKFLFTKAKTFSKTEMTIGVGISI